MASCLSVGSDYVFGSAAWIVLTHSLADGEFLYTLFLNYDTHPGLHRSLLFIMIQTLDALKRSGNYMHHLSEN